jgi:hypothetical protein
VAGAREIGRAPVPISLSNEAALVLLIALELVAILAVVRIWREHGRSLAAQLAWSVITLVPVIGLIAYAVLRDPPPPNGPTDRPPKRSWDIWPGD